MSSSIEITPELLAGFLDEAPEYLEMLDAGLMEFESKAGSGVLSLDDPEDQERMTTMFRAAHSLKGLAAAFGFDKIKELTHHMETLFDQVRMGKRNLTSDSFETLFNVFDKLKDLVAELSDDTGDPVEIGDLLAALERILASSGTDTATQVAGASPEQENPQSAESAPAVEPVAAVSAEQYEILDDPELAAVFLETTVEAIDELNEGLLGLEQNAGDAELLNQVFRCAHNIKGASGAAALRGMNRLTHDMETVFDRLRSSQLALSDELMNAVFQAVDRLRIVTDALKEGRIEDIAANEMTDQFAQWVSDKPAPAKTSPSSEQTSTADASDAAPAASAGVSGEEDALTITIKFAEGFSESSIQAYLIHNKLGDLANTVSSEPDIESLDGDSVLETIAFRVTTDIDPGELEKLISSYDIASVVVTCDAASPESLAPDTASNPTKPASAVEPSTPEVKTPSPATPSAGGANAATGKPSAAPKSATPERGKPARGRGKGEKGAVRTGETLRVDQERLDYLMNLGGELVINRARFVEIHRAFREVLDGKNLGYLVDDMSHHITQLTNRVERVREDEGGGGRSMDDISGHLVHLEDSFRPVRSLVHRVHELRASMFDFDEALHALTRVSEAIQKGIMSTRMVPVGPLFTRFKRVVRDITKANGKQVELVLRGEHTELDKRMIDELGDPLTHMVRNSCDHGIESPEERIAAGKNPKGTLTLEACHRGNSICIIVTDDGAGVNIERVKAKILERELATPAQVEQMSERDLLQYVFKPGFSTAEKVTEVSGRGMGMDIVVNKIEKLNGTIDIDSTPGVGATVTIKLPLTLAILTSLVARINKGIYAIPLESVAEIITVRKEDIQYIQRRQVVRVRERVVPIAWFEDIFATKLPGLKTKARDVDEFTLVIVGFEAEQIGLVVDELLGQEDVVIKSIAENYRNVRGIAGASIRGDGTVSLILDVGAVMEMAGNTGMSAAPLQPALAAS